MSEDDQPEWRGRTREERAKARSAAYREADARLVARANALRALRALPAPERAEILRRASARAEEEIPEGLTHRELLLKSETRDRAAEIVTREYPGRVGETVRLESNPWTSWDSVADIRQLNEDLAREAVARSGGKSSFVLALHNALAGGLPAWEDSARGGSKGGVA